MVEDMAAFVKALKLEKPLVMGYSDGGMVVLKLTSRCRITSARCYRRRRNASLLRLTCRGCFYGKGMPQGQLTDRDL